MAYLQQLAREWYEYRGYFVRENVWVGLESDGSYDCELDVVAYDPQHRHVVHIEPSFDLLPTMDRERHFQLKFDAGKKYLHRMFSRPSTLTLEQIALIAYAQPEQHQTIGGGRVILLTTLLSEMLAHLSQLDLASAPVPEQWPLIRTLQVSIEPIRSYFSESARPSIHPQTLSVSHRKSFRPRRISTTESPRPR